MAAKIYRLRLMVGIVLAMLPLLAGGCFGDVNTGNPDQGNNGNGDDNGGDTGGSDGETGGDSSIEAPAAPTGFEVSAGDETLMLIWQPVESSEGYYAYWDTTQGMAKTTGVRSQLLTDTTFSITGLENGTNYYVVVTAWNSGGEGDESEERAGTPRVPIPTSPTGVAASPGDSEVQVSWDATDQADGYYVYSDVTAGVDADDTRSPLVQAQTYQFSGTNGIHYYFRVSARNSVGDEGPLSLEVGATPEPPTAGVPSGVEAEASVGQVTISWTSVAGAESYNLYWDTSPGVDKDVDNAVNGVTSPYSHTGRTAGTTYYYVVTAVDDSVESSESAEVSATPPLAATAATLLVDGANTCVILSGGRLKCWGQNLWGNLGLGDTNNRGDQPNEMGDNLPFIDLGIGRTVSVAAVGRESVCAILDDDSLKCWGANDQGDLGLGDTSNRGDNPGEMGDNLPTVNLGTGRTAAQVDGGWRRWCAILDDGSVKCWGNNDYGSLGLGNTSNRGDQANEMGDNLPTVSLGAGRTAVSLAGGNYHTCALLDNATVKCWGSNAGGPGGGPGALGYGDTVVRGDQSGEMGDNLPTVNLGSGRTATAIDAGYFHTCAILDNDTLKCWGYNNSGQLGLGDTNNRGDGTGEMGDNLPAIDLGSGRTAVAIATGAYFTCALLDNSTVKCWGANNYGQLGLGNTSNRGDQAGEMGDNLPVVNLGAGRTAVAVATSEGAGHVCARLDNDTVKCWGSGGTAELGYGDTSHRGDQPGEMGDSLPAVDLGTE